MIEKSQAGPYDKFAKTVVPREAQRNQDRPDSGLAFLLKRMAIPTSDDIASGLCG